jgi:F-type H+-transporting ATPase subunit alpha
MDWGQGINASLKSLESEARGIRLRPSVEDLGRVLRVGDGVAFVEGLDGAMLDEIVVFSNGVEGQVFDLGRDVVACVLYGTAADVEANSPVSRTGRLPTVPVGDGVLGRVLDARGRPLDGLGPVAVTEERAVEQAAPGPFQRQPIDQPLFTGVKAVDAAIPIGLGQRELILGDRGTGKTSIALDAIISQRDTGVVCVYASIGRKRSSVVEVLNELRRHAALQHTLVIMADAAEPPALQHLAAYAGCAAAEWFAYQGRHALIVYDDLTRHAEAYRGLSLLLRRPPGREAYPGDIFSVHARIMERAFKLSDALGGGSVTALPILETQRGDISSFISTNLISMTDGQLYLDTELFTQGQLPAIDVGKSVSRVGRDAQPGSMRDAAADLRLELAQYGEVKGFARFGAILDEATTRQIARGERLMAVLGQTERHVAPLAVQVAELWALKTGLLDGLPPDAISRLEARLRALVSEFGYLASQVRSAKALDADLVSELGRWVGRAMAGLPDAGRTRPKEA